MKTIGRFLALKCLDFIDWIYENRPEGEQLTMEDCAAITKSRKMRKEICKKFE